MDSLDGRKCFICNKGIIKPGKILFVEIDSIFECGYCHSEFHRKDGSKYLLQYIPNKSPWKKYDGKLLTSEEMARIATGGLSDVEIKKHQVERLKTERDEKEKKEKLEQAEKEEKERQERRRQIPGTPENYLIKFRNILGIDEDSNEFSLSIHGETREEAKQYIKHIGQLKKELEQLKKEIVLTKKKIKANFDLQKSKIKAVSAAFGSSRALSSLRTAQIQMLDAKRDHEYEPYNIIIGQIESAILLLDKGIIEIENQMAGIQIGNSNKKRKVANEKATEKVANQETEPVLEDVLNKIESLIGLDSIKAEIQELINFLKIQAIRKSRNLPTPNLSLHVVFYGNPGTGKTTVARLLSELYKALGVLSKGHLVETDRSGLVAGYVGQTALKVTEVGEKALGGVLFIDEAYSLTDNDEGGYGREAIDTLVKFMEDHRDDLAVVIAGYTQNMQRFLGSNPGLKSRFNRYWDFKDYTPPELFKIFLSLCMKGHFTISDPAKRKLAVLLQRAYNQRDTSFGNGRLARNIYEATISNQANRIAFNQQISDEALTTIEADDIPENINSL